MHTKTVLTAAIAFFSAATAFAGEATPDYPMAYTPTVSRAEVRAATEQARAAGLIVHGDRTVAAEVQGPGLSRAQVKAETLEAIRLGAISRGEQNTFPTAAQLDSIRMAGERAVAMTMASL